MNDRPVSLSSGLAEAAAAIATEASAVPMRYFRKGVAIDTKTDESPVTVADRETESLIRERITERFPDHGIFGEEHGQVGMDRRYVWVIDPIDGTKSFISGLPLFGMLIGILDGGKAVAGVIRMPGLDETYSGSSGNAARCNGSEIRVRTVGRLGDATVYLNEPNSILKQEAHVVPRLMEKARLLRFSYDCYPYALLASGQIDAVIDYNLQPYDYLPVSPVVEAAGGIMTDWNGKALDLSSDGRVVAAATPELHAELLDILKT